MKASVCEVEHSYTEVINGQEVTVHRYEPTKARAREGNVNNLRFYRSKRQYFSRSLPKARR